MSALRRLCNKAKREGIVIEERLLEDMDFDKLHHLNTGWVNLRGGKERRLLTRPFPTANETDVRCFWAFLGNALVGGIIFDPIYSSGSPVGYYQNFVRYSASAPHGTTDQITWTALSVFKRAGIKRMSFGLSPFENIEDHTRAAVFSNNKLLARLFRILHSHCNWIYPFQGNAFYRRRYRPTPQKSYVGACEGGSLRELLSVFRHLELI